jgi:hypothetical protein
VTVKLTNVNEAPVLASDSFSIKENSDVATEVSGTASLVTDEDIGDAHTYAIVSQDPANIFRITPNTGQLEVKTVTINFEATPQLVVKVRVTDRGGYSCTTRTTRSRWVVNVQDVQEAPVLADTTMLNLPEKSAGGAVVGTLPARAS